MSAPAEILLHEHNKGYMEIAASDDKNKVRYIRADLVEQRHKRLVDAGNAMKVELEEAGRVAVLLIESLDKAGLITDRSGIPRLVPCEGERQWDAILCEEDAR